MQDYVDEMLEESSLEYFLELDDDSDFDVDGAGF